MNFILSIVTDHVFPTHLAVEIRLKVRWLQNLFQFFAHAAARMSRPALMAFPAALFLCLPLSAEAKYASIVIDANSGQVFSAVNADTRNYPASLTKMMTLYVLFDRLKAGKIRLTDKIVISKHAASQAPSKLGLKPGETITVENAIMALCVKSANDVAAAVAEHIGGTEAAFAVIMTQKAQTLGMRQTNFRNASGLPNLAQYSTARDMATLSRALIRNHPGYYKYFSAKEATINGVAIRGHNRLLDWYNGADGIKTGYIAASGFNLATSAERGGRRLIGVVFGGKTAAARDTHMGEIMDEAFARIAPAKGGTIMAAQTPPKPQAQPVSAPQQKGDADYKVVEQAMAIAKAERSGVRAAAPSVAVGDAGGDDSRWAIQVGAFSRKATAEVVAQRAKETLNDILAGGVAGTDSIAGANMTLYRARVVGLSENTARDACRRLVRTNADCRVVLTTSEVAAR